MERKELNETLFTKAFETQHNAFLWVALWVASHFKTMKFASCDDDP
ncbi:hypothetical protein [Leptospira noguchii]|uniref:Uncharacterized protein n=1 Tax=Leptospira noguchii str. 2001034031 TaxID=1193053 RepID=M6Y605_9LEPT|nr:hypothetical protein [Leptospira noguchii]EMO89135.1 hypothetical protein LEP1GSC024_4923 [Leptospira noguchii str. 2001034031]